MSTSLSYDLVIPVLNEEHRLPPAADILQSFFNENNLNNWRITIADNGSTDGTRRVAESIINTHPLFNFISVGRKGVGLALETTWKQSKADVVGYIDVDLATDIRHLLEVANLFENEHADIVNGSRNLSLSKVVNRKPIRTITSKVFNFILRMVFNISFTDGMCGFKFLRKNIYDRIRMRGTGNEGWFFCTEILVIAEKLGYSINEIPVHWTDDQDSRVKIARLSTEYLKQILKLKLRTDLSPDNHKQDP